ncbi:hypothetical protein [Sphingobium nicotianae]|uniref:Uncharacterized protein n=1 Tax=Sphingobium nicotianae TaxID=2782607 RepID=A0A9X1DCC1_9SPHN|nr:hypothetical protein [Sphingobium nicotianae]MBT2187269.1 hypothetical protein [Sphingobium nicotianae]
MKDGRAYLTTGNDAAFALLSDTDLVELWFNAADQDHPTPAEAAIRDELTRRDIQV